MADPIQRWSPFREMEHFRRDFDDLFDRFLGRRKRGERRRLQLSRSAGPEYREDSATITPEEQARRSKLLTHQRAQAVPALSIATAAG